MKYVRYTQQSVNLKNIFLSRFYSSSVRCYSYFNNLFNVVNKRNTYEGSKQFSTA